MKRKDPNNESLGRKVFFLSLESLGLYAGIYCFLRVFKSLFSPLQAKMTAGRGYGPAFLGQVGSTLEWAVICAVTVALVLAVERAKREWSPRDLGFKLHRSLGRDIWLGVVVFGLLYLVTLPILMAVLPFKANLAGQPYLKEMTQLFSSAYLFLPAVVALLVSEYTCAFWEEIFWRGYVQSLFSKEIAPVSGFLAASLFFGLGHYFTRPEWGLLDVLLALIGGVFLGLVYYVTGSIYVSAFVHTLLNTFWTYPFMAYLKGSAQTARVSMLGLGALCLILVVLGRKEAKYFLAKTNELFAHTRLKFISIGIFLSIIFLTYSWGQQLLLLRVNRTVFLSVLGAFAVTTLGLSFFQPRSLPKDKNPGLQRAKE